MLPTYSTCLSLLSGPIDKHCARKNAIQRAAGDQHAVVLAERGFAMIARGHDLIDVRGAAPTLLRERQVHADADDLDVGKLAGFLVESLGF